MALRRGAWLAAALLSCSPGAAEEPERPPLEAFLDGYAELLETSPGGPHRARFADSAFVRRLAEDGRLASAVMFPGEPPGLVFSMTVEGRRRRLLLLPSFGEPPSPERLYLLTDDGQGRSVDARALTDPAALDTELRAALGRRPAAVEHVAAEALRDALASAPSGALAASGGAALARARRTGATLTGEDEPGETERTERTPWGVRYHARGTRPGVELYARDVGDRHVFIRYEDGIPRITHVWDRARRGWASFADANLPESFFSETILQQTGSGPARTLAAYRFGADGIGRRTHQRVEDGGVGAWVALPEGRLLAPPPEGTARRLVRTREGTFLIEFGPGSARVTHAGGPENGATLSAGPGSAGPASFEAGHGDFHYSFRRGSSGRYEAAPTHQKVTAEDGVSGWIRLSGRRPLEEADLVLARRVVSAEARVAVGRASAEARRDRGLYGASVYPRVSGMAAAVLGPPPAAITIEEVRRRAGTSGTAPLPGADGMNASVVLAGPAPSGPPRRQLIVMAGDPAASADIQRTLEAYRTALTAAARADAGSQRDALGAFLRGLDHLGGRMVPERATLVLTTTEGLASNIHMINGELARAPYVAAGQGALENGQSGRGENALSRPGIFGVRGRIAARRVSGSASANRGRAQSEMWNARASAVALAADGLQAARLRAAVEARQGFTAGGVRAVDVLDVEDPSVAAAYRARLGPSGIAIPYRLEGGRTYFLAVAGDADALRATAAVDVALTDLARRHPDGIPRQAVIDAWAVHVGQRRAEEIVDPPAPAAPASAPERRYFNGVLHELREVRPDGSRVWYPVRR